MLAQPATTKMITALANPARSRVGFGTEQRLRGMRGHASATVHRWRPSVVVTRGVNGHLDRRPAGQRVR